MKYKCYIILTLLCVIQLAIGVQFGMKKINYHEDEIFTFGLSNNLTGKDILVSQGERITRNELNSYVTVDSEHRFNYANVWRNQALDVHPPLYYMLIHTMCSLFPGKFIPMGGIGLNIFFSLLATLLVFLITKELTNNNFLSLLTSVAWAFSLGNVSFIVFIRMYLMLTVCMLAITLLHIKYFSKKITYRFYVGIAVLSIIGTLTHYYFLIYLFFICLIFGIRLLYNRQFKSAMSYITALACAGIASIAIFPAMLSHIFGGYRGVQSFDNIKIFSDIFDRYLEYDSYIGGELFCSFSWILYMLILVLSLIFLFKNKNKINWQDVFFSKYNFILFPTLFYFALVGKISVFVTDRYMMPIFPMILIIAITSITFLSTNIFKLKYIAIIEASLFVILSIVGLGLNSNVYYLYQNTSPAIDFAKANKDADVLVIYYDEWMLNGSFEEFIQYDHLTLIREENLKDYADVIAQYHDSIVYLNTEDNQKTLESLKQINPNWNSYTAETTVEYFNGYKLFY